MFLAHLFSGDIYIPVYQALSHVRGIMEMNSYIPEFIVIKKRGQSTCFVALKSLRSHI